MNYVVAAAVTGATLALSSCRSVEGRVPEGEASVPSSVVEAGGSNLHGGMSFYNHMSHHSRMYGVRVFQTEAGVEFRGRDQSPATGELLYWRVRRNLTYQPTAIRCFILGSFASRFFFRRFFLLFLR